MIRLATHQNYEELINLAPLAIDTTIGPE